MTLRFLGPARLVVWTGALALTLPGCEKARELAGGQGSQGSAKAASAAIDQARQAAAGGPPPSPILSPEAAKARGALEAVITSQPDNGEVRLALAELLAPYALAEPTPEPESPAETEAPAEGEEAAPSPEPGKPVEAAEVTAAFAAAAGLDATRSAALEGFVGFCRVAECLDAVDATFRNLLAAMPQDPDLPASYGDFLGNEMGDRAAAVEQYRIALIWRPDNTELRSRIARLHLARAFDHLEWGEYPQAENAFEESKAFISSTASPEWAKLREGMERLNRIRPNR